MEGSLRIGLVGCGSIAQVHLKSIAALGPDCRLIAAADCERDRAERAAEEFGAVCYQDWREMLDRERLDALHICTPHHLHTPMAAEALEKGISVFLEKPPAITWEQLDHLKETADKARGKARLAVCFQNRLHPRVQYVKTLLQECSLGEVTGIRGFVTWNREGAYYSDSPWRGRLATEGGGALINQGIHTLDLMQYLMGCAPVDADAACENFHLKGEIEVEDTLTAYVRYPAAKAVLYVTTAYAADVPPLIEVQCQLGRVRMEEDEVRIWREETEEIRNFPERKGFGKSCWGSCHQEAIRGFYESLRNGSPYLLDFEQVQETVKLMLRLYGAARGEEKAKEAGSC